MSTRPNTTGIKLNPEIKARLAAIASLRDRTPHWLMKHAILEYLEREERYEREKKEDEERYEEYKKTGKGISQAQMETWVNSLPEDKH